MLHYIDGGNTYNDPSQIQNFALPLEKVMAVFIILIFIQ